MNQTAIETAASDRNATIAALKSLLKARNLSWVSVRGGQGSAWGWIKIKAKPARLDQFGYMSQADRKALGDFFGMEKVHQQGLDIAASTAYRRECLERAAGKVPSAIAQPYWD